EGNLDPKRGNLGNWALAARLIVSAQYLRNRFLEEQHQRIYDDVERPRYVELFRWVLKLPYSFEPECYHRIDLRALAVARGVTNNDCIDEYTLSIMYRFALGLPTGSDKPGEQPELGEIADGWQRSRGAEGMLEYADRLRAVTGQEPLVY